MVERADGTETVMGLPQLDEFFGYDEKTPGPSVLQITTETGRKFVETRKAAGAGNAVINRSLACLRRMLRIAKEEEKIPSVPVIRMLKEPPARRGFVPRDQFDALLKRWVPNRIYAPGTTPAYSNYGASLAGYIVQRVSGEPFDAYVQRHIFAPLGMQHATFTQPLPANLKPLMAEGLHLGQGQALRL
jgi:hypothetical protein